MDATSIARGTSIDVMSSSGAQPASAAVIPTQSLNAPVLSVQSTASPGDNVTALVTTSDSDGATTTGVQIIDNGTLLGSATGGGGSWSYAINGITSGSHVVVARRQTSMGSVDSVPHTVSVSSGNVQGSLNVNLPSGAIQDDLGTGRIQVGL